MSFENISGGHHAHSRGSMNDTAGTDGLSLVKTKLAQFQVSFGFGYRSLHGITTANKIR
jgi:hypothetical protein